MKLPIVGILIFGALWLGAYLVLVHGYKEGGDK